MTDYFGPPTPRTLLACPHELAMRKRALRQRD
jgi:hypothetical protein